MLYKMEYLNSEGTSYIFSREAGSLITDFSLLSGLDIKIGTSQSINQVGVTVESQLIEAKTSTIKGFIVGDGQEQKRQMMRVILPLDKGRIVVNDEYFMEVYAAKTPLVERERRFPKFEFAVTAPYPFWEKCRETEVAMTGVTGGFKFPWNIARPYTFGERKDDYFTDIHNGGQIGAFYDLVMTAAGEVANPFIEDVKTGNFLRINKTLEATESVTVNVRPDSLKAVSNIYGDIDGLIDIDSNYFAVPVGDSKLKYSAARGREYIEVKLCFREKQAGVVV